MNRSNFMKGVDKYKNIIKHAVSVISSAVTDIEYERGSRVMTVRFKNGRTYEYSNVPLEVFKELMLSGSKGQFINSKVVGIYEYKEIK